MIWVDGAIQDSTTAPFDLADRGLLLGDGLFETILVLNGRPFRFDAHLARLEAGAACLRLSADMPTVRRAVRELAARFDGPAAVRVTVTRGAGPRGLAIPEQQHPRIFASAAPWSPSMAFRPQRLRLSTIRRNETSPLSGIKALNYLDNILALDAATKAGGDDALLLSTRGRVACTAVANVLVLQGSDLVTPPLTDGVLPGTMRALLLDLAASCGLTPREDSLTVEDLRRADAVVSTNSLRLISRATSLDDHPLPMDGSTNLRGIAEALCSTIANECDWTPPLPADFPS